MYISLLIDCEDFITPEDDDATLAVAETISSLGLRATLCVVGEKARRLMARGRTDVIEAMKRHDIGLHTDRHSMHPTTAEALEGRGWEDGIEAIVRMDSPGVKAVRDAFGVEPSCWGGGGNTWGPQVAGALPSLGIPAYVYAHTAPPGSDLHRFRGVTAYGGGLYLGDGLLHSEEPWREHQAALHKALLERRDAGAEWCEVFTCHPCVLRCEEFWDGVNFARGASPPESEWKPARLRPSADYETALRHLRASLEAVAALPGIAVRTIREMNGLAAVATEVPLTDEELAQTEARVRERLASMPGWAPHKLSLDVSRIIELTVERLPTLRKLRLCGA
jgi:hypothetical protein